MVGLMSMDLPPSIGEGIILGDTFIKTFYTNFNKTGNSVGFAIWKSIFLIW